MPSLDDVVLPGEETARRVTFDDLVRTGCINVANYSPRSSDQASQGNSLHFELHATTPPPAIEMEVYV
jgi:hypothetical protein